METQSAGSQTRRGLGGWGDMVRSMGLILVVVGVMLAVTWQPAPTQQIHEVDAAAVAVGAAKNADFAPLLPKLPSGWKATSARLEPAADDAAHYSWHIGYVSPAGDYFALEQSSTVLPDKFVAQWTQGMTIAESAMGAGSWSHYVDNDGNGAFVLLGGSTTLVLIAPQTPEAKVFQQAVDQALGR